jgi:hypothetical protein
MRKAIAASVVAIGLAVGGAAAGTAAADPSNRCYGEVASGIASTWPWAHEGQMAFPPPPGGLALWVEAFGPEVGVSSVRELQLLFCS